MKLDLHKTEEAIKKAEQGLIQKQNPDGSWIGEVELNPGPTAQVVMLHEAIKRPFPEHLKIKAQRYIERVQNPDGGWSTHLGAPSDVSVALECYVALRALGVARDSVVCKKALQYILNHGSVEKANPWTQLYLAVLGIIPWEKIYKTPIHILLLPPWLPVQLKHFSYWVKAITIPMALLGCVGPGEPIYLAQDLKSELKVDQCHFHAPALQKMVQQLFKIGETLNRVSPKLKSYCIELALKKVDELTEEHGDFGGNTCTALNVLLSLYQLNQSQTAQFENGYKALMGYVYEDENEWRMQCCQSHVWDTGFALNALTPKSPQLQKNIQMGLNWLRDRQILNTKGPWSHNVDCEPGGWCFGDRHNLFPVTDCSATSLLSFTRHTEDYHSEKHLQRAVNWLLAMQHEEGGWSAYEKYEKGEKINQLLKFKDIDNALVDVPKADVSAKVLESLFYWRKYNSKVEPALFKGRDFLLSKRNALGLWAGNYGVNYIYGTTFSVKALHLIDEGVNELWAGPARQFYLENQNGDGGWGESDESYHKKQFVAEHSSPVQTAWALMGLLACYKGTDAELSAIRQGHSYLLRTQKMDGAWQEERFLGTVFPGMVYFRYTLYPYYFPLMALQGIYNLLSPQVVVGKSRPHLEIVPQV